MFAMFTSSSLSWPIWLHFLYNSHVLAIPFTSKDLQQLSPRETTDNSISMPIWLPIVLFVLLGAGLAVCVYTKRAVRRSFGPASARSDSALQDVTADQLAGGTQAANANANANGTRSRRPRRTRRTPSQISTTSLPTYMKEPGEQELVIFQGNQEMEDTSVLPTAVAMPSVTEQEHEESMHSRDNSHPSVYAPMPVTSNEMPLLESHQPTEDDPSPQDDRDRMSNRSVHTMNSSEDSSMSQDTGEAGADPRGEAPPYFEVPLLQHDETMATTDAHTSGVGPSASEPTVSPPTTNSTTPERRRSGFRAILEALSSPTSRSIPSIPRALSRTPVTRNAAPSNLALPERPPLSSFHRPSQSGSRSMFNISPFRPISPEWSNHTLPPNRMNSPSLISLNSISSPLTHTLVRSEFTYPKSGPTPEQLKFISSRESLGRFGLPYGPDAIAYAASTSRQELYPPPDFDAPGSSVPPSRAEPPSSLAVIRPELSLSPLAAEYVPEQVVTLSESPEDEPPSSPPAADADSTSIPPVQIPPATTTTTVTPPSSFIPSPSFLRSESRTSSALSYATFNTAPESMGGDPDEPSIAVNNSSGPPSATILHFPEGTEVTITPG